MVVDAGAIAQLAQLISSPDARLKVEHYISSCGQRAPIMYMYMYL